MSLTNASNKERARRRAQCRDLLSQHLRSKLCIEITPAEVRLHPRQEDLYRWSILPQKQHLFEKNLSKLSTNIYIQIIEGIGVFFEAVPWPSISSDTPRLEKQSQEKIIHSPTSNDVCASNGLSASLERPSFPECPSAYRLTANISRLEDEALNLRQEAIQWKNIAELESGTRVKLEGELEKIKLATIALRKECLRSQKEAHRFRIEADQFRAKIAISKQGVRQLMDITNQLAAFTAITPRAPTLSPIRKI